MTTTATAIRYYAVVRNSFGVPPLGKPCNFPICYWQAIPGSSETEITVTNCGTFYVYFLKPTLPEDLKMIEPLPINSFQPKPLPIVYCTTRKDITKGNGYEITFSFQEVYFLLLNETFILLQYFLKQTSISYTRDKRGLSHVL